ncbi:hypothetical protein KAFR_0K02180 [Kazachstania africana CBS 2517]|uniref:Uncharacterized protein n=1 Tax=Kazachstania africana (strain ATCC 22294 / BCRC 22015 / CBS 2517 / CECT 1963 / NBRC 1671 / NRRL Y-8276) TaxID=1071382 RepID=H2B1S2_KAZAF|nr:hypothetical protein KAFR_0K02180 [Kazachstania africana CBS 2517]CCF60572.1 hypothetical protein KAFR_0K02180 [Kazachstania africana CBS 2517]
MAFLELTADISQPFVIPNISPVSQQSSRKNSDADVTALDEIDKFLNSINDRTAVCEDVLESSDQISAHSGFRARKGSLTLL